ncbi:Endoribonuclease Dicer 3a [Grifola frondosa]|uniref:Endoribonuclease Dicer 3a n=1 Tax=Grifola frondosa TaxID=5627 RepID=A0A1C7MDV8_GRIFR|nr:Endoribonuclease Dicer 3a [Grifola frondosa]
MVLPELCHRLTDVYRAHAARIELGLPLIVDDLLVQALTLPSANAGFNNQRLETLGDAVLKLCSVVHVFNKFPHRHEGQLDVLRRNSVSNRTLLARAKEQCLERYLTSEAQSTRLWRYTLPNHAEPTFAEPRRYVLRHFARRSLQDCMEATLGAGFATGGIDMALRTGTALGLSFGGPLPWNARYGGLLPETPTSVLFAELQETLGYHFKHGQLLLEAVTHPSFHSPDSSSYQRLEFLGDALIDLVVMRYLYDKFPEATSGQLSWARSRAVCAPALASIAVKRLALHKILLVNNVELSYAISKYAPVLESMSSVDIINTGWKHDPPKAISDVLESIFGALFIDCDHNFEKAAAITEMIMQDFLVELSPNLPRDPVSELMIWAARSGCSQIKFQKSQSVPEVKRYDSVSVIVHGITVVGPITAQNLSLSKGLAAEDARIVLGDPESEYSFSRICDCGSEMAVDVDDTKQADLALDPKEKNALDDETTEGFATLARIMADEIRPSQPDAREGVMRMRMIRRTWPFGEKNKRWKI